MSSADLRESLALLQDAIRDGDLDDVPEGWRTCRQWATAWGVSRPCAQRVLQEAREKGLAERRDYRVRTAGRSVYPTPHYRVRASV